jgi:hypothetical protein
MTHPELLKTLPRTPDGRVDVPALHDALAPADLLAGEGSSGVGELGPHRVAGLDPEPLRVFFQQKPQNNV